MLKYRVSLFLFFFIFCSVAQKTSGRTLKSPLGPIVDIGYAAFAGNTTSPAGVENGPVVFYGNIPYAQPPLGELRFRAPKMLDEQKITSHVDDARGWGPPCIQRPAVVGIGSEDCLKLNIWKPTNATSADKLPVAVYIHGGGFYANSPQGFPMYDWVAQHPGGIVAVSMAYRMNIFGFLGGETVASDGDLNNGLLDQQAALEWVQRHIKQFGGDPDNVTIYGESAGGASVVMQLVAYGGTRTVPFKGVTAQSIGFGPTSTQDQVEAAFTSAAAFAGCPTAGKQAMDCLRSASVGALVSAVNRVPNGAFAPVIDGPNGFLPDLPSRLIASGNFSAVDYVGGHCTGDGKTFASGKPSSFATDDDIRRIVFSRWPGVSNATINKALALYPPPDAPNSPFPTQWDRAWTMAGEIIFTCMDWFLAENLLLKGAKNVYAYSWDAPDTVLYNAKPYLGAMHTSDIYYLFDGTNTFDNAGNTFTPLNSSEALLSAQAIAFWTSFAATGRPSSNAESESAWETFASSVDSTRRRMNLSRGSDTKTGSTMKNITMEEIERCRFWMSEEVVTETRI